MEDYSIFIIILSALLAIITLSNYNDFDYSYIDLNNNKGIADYCYTDGNMFCDLKDNTTIQVQEYQKLIESSDKNE